MRRLRRSFAIFPFQDLFFVVYLCEDALFAVIIIPNRYFLSNDD